jgi:hypothetical protein
MYLCLVVINYNKKKRKKKQQKYCECVDSFWKRDKQHKKTKENQTEMQLKMQMREHFLNSKNYNKDGQIQ